MLCIATHYFSVLFLDIFLLKLILFRHSDTYFPYIEGANLNVTHEGWYLNNSSITLLSYFKEKRYIVVDIVVATWSECCNTRMTGHNPITSRQPSQSYYDNGLTSLIPFAGGLSTRFCHIGSVELWLPCSRASDFAMPWGGGQEPVYTPGYREAIRFRCLANTWKYCYIFVFQRKKILSWLGLVVIFNYTIVCHPLRKS